MQYFSEGKYKQMANSILSYLYFGCALLLSCSVIRERSAVDTDPFFTRK